MNNSTTNTKTFSDPNILSSTRKRFSEFDILRAISMLLMVIAHTWEEFSRFMESSLWRHYELFSYTYALIGPSVLMICLGTNLSFARTKEPKELAKRGLIFLGIDFSLNLVRFGVPAFLLALMGKTQFISFFVRNLLSSDIYAFVGALFLLFAFFQKYKLTSSDILFIAVGMLTFNTFLDYAQLNIVSNEWLTHFLGRFFYMGWSSYFSLFPWFIFPAIGFYFGNSFKNMTVDEQHYNVRKLFTGCVVGFFALCIVLLKYNISPAIANIALNDYKTDLFSITLMILLGGISFSLAHWFVMKSPNSCFVSVCQKISKIIMPFYVIQWIIIGWLELFVDAFELPLIINSAFEMNAIAFTIIAVTMFLAFQYTKRKASKRKKNPT